MSKVLELKSHESKTFSRPEDGSYVGTVVGVIDLGTQPADAFGGPSSKLLLQVELVDEPQADGAPTTLLKEVKYVLSSGSTGYSPSTLFTTTKALLNTNTTKLEDYIKAGKFTVDQLLGKSAMVTVGTTAANKEKGFTGGRAKITSFAPLLKGVTVTEPKTKELLHFDIDASDRETFDKLSEFLQKRIQSAPEFNIAGSTNDIGASSELDL